MSQWDNILTRTPVNKAASVVTNQCGCADNEQLARLVEQRESIKSELAKLYKYRSGGRVRKKLIQQHQATLGRLNKQLRPLDALKPRDPKSESEAFMSAARLVLDNETFMDIRRMARLATQRTNRGE